MTPLPAPLHPACPRRGFSLIEFLMVAFILAVGLLGLGGMQAATARAHGGAGNRMTAAILAGNALEEVLAEAGRASRARRGGEALPGSGKYTGPGYGPWVARFGRDGRPTEARSAFYTVTVTRTAPGTREGRDAVPAAWAFRAAVTWPEGPGPAPGRLDLARIVAL